MHHNPLMRPDIFTSIIKTNKLLSILISQPYYMLLPTWIPLPKYRLLSTSIALPEYRQVSTSISLPKYRLLSTLISLPKYRLLSTWVSLSTCEKKIKKKNKFSAKQKLSLERPKSDVDLENLSSMRLEFLPSFSF